MIASIRLLLLTIQGRRQNVPSTPFMPIDWLVHSPRFTRSVGILSSGVAYAVDAIGERQDGPRQMPLFYTGKVGKL
jgi:hypothetical protein